MNTNIDGLPGGLPDTGALERLANELFKALPGEMPSPTFSPNPEDHPTAQKMLGIVQQGFGQGLPSSHPQPHQDFNLDEQ